MNFPTARYLLHTAAAIALAAMLLLVAACAEDTNDSVSLHTTPASIAAPEATATADPNETVSSANPNETVSSTDADETVSSADPVPTPEPPRETPPDMEEVPAPLESVEIHIAESWPPQYFVEVISGLPNGCAEFNGYEESRAGNTIVISVNNLMPAPSQQVACTEEYRTHRISIPLGEDFQSGETYTVQVNDVSETFVAQ